MYFDGIPCTEDVCVNGVCVHREFECEQPEDICLVSRCVEDEPCTITALCTDDDNDECSRHVCDSSNGFAECREENDCAGPVPITGTGDAPPPPPPPNPIPPPPETGTTTTGTTTGPATGTTTGGSGGETVQNDAADVIVSDSTTGVVSAVGAASVGMIFLAGLVIGINNTKKDPVTPLDAVLQETEGANLVHDNPLMVETVANESVLSA